MSNKSIFDVIAKDGGYNQQLALIASVLNKASIATLVKIVEVYPESQLVDVLLLVDQADGHGNAIPHGIVYGLGYIRYQGGLSAVILDPVVDDIGLCIFCHNDISNVKKTGKQALPNSARRNDWADGIYIGGLLNATPTQFVQFESAGITVKSPVKVTIDAPNVDIIGDTAFTGTVTANGKSIDDSHTHSGVQTGSGNTGAPN